MCSASPSVTGRSEPDLAGQTVVLIGGSAGIGLETAKCSRAHGANVILTGRNPDRLIEAARDVEARQTAAFDATDDTALKSFFENLSTPVDHVMVGHVTLYLAVARHSAGKMTPHGSLIFMGGTGGRRVTKDLGIVPAATAALPPFTAALALELAPIRVNLIAAGFVDTPLSAALLGERLDERRAELRAKLPIGRVVGPADVAALAVHLMTNTALTGATYDIDGGQQFVQ